MLEGVCEVALEGVWVDMSDFVRGCVLIIILSVHYRLCLCVYVYLAQHRQHPLPHIQRPVGPTEKVVQEVVFLGTLYTLVEGKR